MPTQLLTERQLAFEPAPGEGPNVFQNVYPLWQPLWARGIYGGAIIAQSLAAAQHVVPAGFLVHSMHCHFIRAAVVDKDKRITYHVTAVREGKSVSVWSVQARQNGDVIFSTVISFARNNNPKAKKKQLEHQATPPPAVWAKGPPTAPGAPIDQKRLSGTGQTDGGSLMESVRIPREKVEGPPATTRLLNWARMRTIPADGNSKSDTAAHLTALAYISDAYFIGTAARVHKAERFISASTVQQLKKSVDATTPLGKQKLLAFQALSEEEREDNKNLPAGAEFPGTVEMMVTLSHTIFFHNPQEVRADDWLLVEAEAPWAGEERGLVYQKIWNSSGVLVATCIQEGVIRLQQDTPHEKSKI